MRVWELLEGRKCPECGGIIDGGSLRYEGWAWTHKGEHAQAGHHAFDFFEAIGVDPHEPGFVVNEVHDTPGDDDTLDLVGSVRIPIPDEVEPDA